MEWKKIWEASKWPVIGAIVFSIALIIPPLYDAIQSLPIFWAWFLIVSCFSFFLGYNGTKNFRFGYIEVFLSTVLLSAILSPSAILVSFMANLVPGAFEIPGLIGLLFMMPTYFVLLFIPVAVISLIGAFIAKKLK